MKLEFVLILLIGFLLLCSRNRVGTSGPVEDFFRNLFARCSNCTDESNGVAIIGEEDDSRICDLPEFLVQMIVDDYAGPLPPDPLLDYREWVEENNLQHGIPGQNREWYQYYVDDYNERKIKPRETYERNKMKRKSKMLCRAINEMEGHWGPGGPGDRSPPDSGGGGWGCDEPTLSVVM